MPARWITVDGNEAAARIAHLTSEVIAIYPITPASTMGELADAWSAEGRTNVWGAVPRVVEMQSEAGAAGAVHGALQAGSIATTFTASQGLLLMIPNLYKIAGELTPAVIHVAARTIATHALSIFGDHSDVMAARPTGFAMLAASSVQEAQDMALIAQAATLESRVPFLHFFDGFRTSHEINKIEELGVEDVRSFLDPRLVREHRKRALNPDHPVLRGSAQNPDVFFQAREAANPFHEAVPAIVTRTFERFAALSGRRYRLFDYVGAPDAERVVVLMGSGMGAVTECVDELVARGERVGAVVVRLFRPFSIEALNHALPRETRSIAVLDRTKEPGALGEPLYQDVVTALAEGWWLKAGVGATLPRVVGGRYGLASKEFTPAMAKAVFDELAAPAPRNHFTLGIVDDVTRRSLKHDPTFRTEHADVTRAVFFGLGSDGTVGANKNSVKIIGESTPLHAQGYFVYDSKKSGATTVSHLRFGPRPIHATYLVEQASFVACHQFELLHKMDVLGVASEGATFLLNCPYPAHAVWDRLPRDAQDTILAKGLRVYTVDADRVAREAGLEGRVNTVLQTCFFALSGVLERGVAIEAIKTAVRKTYARRGDDIVRKNEAAIDRAIAALEPVSVPDHATATTVLRASLPAHAPDFVQRVTSLLLAGKGDLLPVSALPVDGTFPVGTARFEKRSIAREIPIWDPSLCIDCGLCSLVCPHAAIRMKVYPPAKAAGAPDGFRSKPWSGKDFAGSLLTIQVFPEDCTGCAVCVDVCPAKSKEHPEHRALDMRPKEPHLAVERRSLDFFLEHLPDADRHRLKVETVKGSQLLAPLFEFSGACAGCGETPYLKLLTQLFGDRMMVANATGCSSIFGGNLPTTPWTTNPEGRGPAWANSLFEDNAEFGLGMRLAVDQRRRQAETLLRRLAPALGEATVGALLEPHEVSVDRIAAARARIAELTPRLVALGGSDATDLLSVVDALVPRSVWIVGGDGWAYDIGFGGVDQVLSSGADVNLLVLDTEVYSNTGGQASKATPRGAVAKFAAGGKPGGKKDLGMIAMGYGHVYVAQVALGANPAQTIRALSEAESYHGTSLVIAYSHCIAHGIKMATAMSHQKEAVSSGYWPLFRYDPRVARAHRHAFRLDSHKPTLPFREFALEEDRFATLARTDPEKSAHLIQEAQEDIDARWSFYEQMAGVDRPPPLGDEAPSV